MGEEELTRWVERMRHAAATWKENKPSTDNIRKNWCIYRIPAYMTTLGTHNNYKPQLVSLGPYNHGQEYLKTMEEAKERALVRLLHKSGKNIQHLIDCLRPHERSLMDAYECLNEEWQKEEIFLKMLILDGCFIITIIKKDFFKHSKSDPIFRSTRVIQLIKRDMLLLENQLPFFVIEKLTAELKINDIQGFIQRFFFPGTVLKVELGDTKNHLLDIIRLTMLQKIPTDQVTDMHHPRSGGFSYGISGSSGGSSSRGDGGGHEGLSSGSIPFGGAHTPRDESGSPPIIRNSYSATTLHHSNIKFIKSRSDSFMGIMLDNYTIHLPAIVFDQHSEAFFSNLIAFEQLHFQVRRNMSSFLLLMGGLSIMPEDVQLLRDNDIIQNGAMSDTEVTKIIQNITRGLSFTENDEFFRLQEQLNNSYVANKRFWRRKINTWLTKLNEEYLDSPWSVMEVIKTTMELVALVGGAYYTYESFKLISPMLYKFIGL